MTPSNEMTAREAANLLLAELSMILDPDLGDDEAKAVRDKCQEAIAKARREALEEAARMVEYQIGWTGQIPPYEQRQIAAAIRARVK